MLIPLIYWKIGGTARNKNKTNCPPTQKHRNQPPFFLISLNSVFGSALLGPHSSKPALYCKVLPVQTPVPWVSQEEHGKSWCCTWSHPDSSTFGTRIDQVVHGRPLLTRMFCQPDLHIQMVPGEKGLAALHFVHSLIFWPSQKCSSDILKRKWVGKTHAGSDQRAILPYFFFLSPTVPDTRSFKGRI